MSRVIEGRFIFKEKEKERFCYLLKAYCKMTGIELVTWVCMSNHFHLLVRVPHAEKGRNKLEDQDIIKRLSYVTNRRRLDEIEAHLKRLRTKKNKEGEKAQQEYESYRNRLLKRMYDLPSFMRELKQRFTQWYNRREKRKGPLWIERYKSVLLEKKEKILEIVAAYIDLNPVRGGIVEDPKDYRWSGYGEAIVGNDMMRQGISSLYGLEGLKRKEWEESQRRYRVLIYGQMLRGQEGSGSRQTKENRTKIIKELERGGDLETWQILRCRIRYFSEGLALGGENFVEDVFAQQRIRMRVKRLRGARIPRSNVLWGWTTLRDLRGKVINLS